MDNYEKFAGAIKGGMAATTPTSPLGNFPEIANMYKSTFQLGDTAPATAALGNESVIQAANAERAAAAAQQAEIDRLRLKAEEIRDMNDPSKYQKVKQDDGGFDYFNPKGERIDLTTYSKATGQRRADVLKDSENNLDLQFREDYSSLEDLLTAIANKDRERIDTYYSSQPELKGMTPEQLVKRFKDYYASYYGREGGARGTRQDFETPIVGSVYAGYGGSGISAGF